MSTVPVSLNNTSNDLETLRRELEQVGIVPLERGVAGEIEISKLRRGRLRLQDDSVGTATLVDVDGVWFWEQGIVTRNPSTRRAKSGMITLFGGMPITTVKFEKLGINQIAAGLEALDKNLTPAVGLHEYKDGTLAANAVPLVRGRILLFVHGTFSNNQRLFDEFCATSDGNRFLADIAKKVKRVGVNYDQVLAFNHCTVSRSPVLNGLELARIMAESKADIDIVCHSRGGLVTRWFMEYFDRVDRGRRRVVFVGAPLGGTSLAAPDRLRNSIHLFTNIGKVVGNGLSLIPYTQVAGSLMQIVFSLGDFASRSPLVDGAIAMIPGLAAMSRVENNYELNYLRDCSKSTLEYSAITSVFNGEDIGWKFWKVFCGFKLRVADGAAHLIFRDAQGNPCENDLVVDTASMTEYGLPPNAIVKSFGDKERVYHTNYFQQVKTIDFIRKQFGIV